MRAADALFSGARAPVDAIGEKAREDTLERPSGGQDEGDEPRGRILRAIEVSTEDPFAALEAERTPKRRGRKPGSKNKPKIPATVQAIVDATPTFVAPSVPDGPITTPAAMPSDAVVASPQAPISTRARQTERYAWVRKRLGPGEKWKRRLPKVAW